MFQMYKAIEGLCGDFEHLKKYIIRSLGYF